MCCAGHVEKVEAVAEGKVGEPTVDVAKSEASWFE